MNTCHINTLQSDLITTGYHKINTGLTEPEQLTQFMLSLGENRYTTAAHAVLRQSGSWPALPHHIDRGELAEPIPEFALGGIIKAISGGATRIYDARSAAANVLRHVPTFADVTLPGRSPCPGDQPVRPVLESTGEHEPVLRVRPVKPQDLRLDSGPDDEELYRITQQCIDDALIYEEVLHPGDVIIVNNRTTVHDRTSFNGNRAIVRVRYDDPTDTNHHY